MCKVSDFIEKNLFVRWDKLNKKWTDIDDRDELIDEFYYHINIIIEEEFGDKLDDDLVITETENQHMIEPWMLDEAVILIGDISPLDSEDW